MNPLFSERLLIWYDKNARQLPWRESKDAYRVWLSEIMLQQTQVTTVIDYFKRFVDRYPTVGDLASADEEEVYKLWEGLGYYSRATRLMQCARIVSSRYNGRFPEDLKSMLALPGIGSYTAGALLSIAYDMKVPAVDGNVFRVVARQLCNGSDIGKTSTRKEYESIVEAIIPERAGDFTQALMELGATVCSPVSPKCTACPVSEGCLAYERQSVDSFPVRTARKKQVRERMAVGIITSNDKILFIKRDTDGLLASQWGLPIVDITRETLADYASEELDITLSGMTAIGKARHVFTHKIWEMDVYTAEASYEATPDEPETRWLSIEEVEAIAVPTAFKKALTLHENK